MSTLTEIQTAVASLRDDEKQALSLWLASQTPAGFQLNDRERLLRSLDEAIMDVDAGRGVSVADARQLIASWAAK